MVGEPHCVELGLLFADVCRALDWVTNGKKLNELGQTVRDAMNLSTLWVEQAIHISNCRLKYSLGRRTVTDIQTKLANRGKWSAFSRRFYTVYDREDRCLEIGS